MKRTHCIDTQYGFEFGCARIERVCSEDWVVMRLKTPRKAYQIYVTPTGLVRLFDETDPNNRREIDMKKFKEAK